MIRSKKKYFLIYTVLFIVLFFCCFGIYLLVYQKSPLRWADTYDMHYMEFVYLGRWVRAAIRQFKFPVWDPSIGYGADFVTIMSSFIFDPVNWIAVITPVRFAEIGFLLMVAFRFYLCGISYSIFAFRRKHSPYAVLSGAIAYVFCACAYTGMYQSIFIVPMYLFPLLVCGADDLMAEQKKSYLYVFTLAYCTINYFYITYMSVILLIGYCVLKWAFSEDISHRFGDFIKLVSRFALCSIAAAGIAAVVILPLALVMLDMNRLSLPKFIPLLYDRGFYANMFKGFIATFDMQGRDCKIGFSTLSLFCVLALFLIRDKRYRQLKIEFIVLSLALCIPFVGHVMNGFGYVANRWIWAYALLIAYIVTVVLPYLKQFSLRQRILLSLLSCAYLGIAFGVMGASGRPFRILSLAFLIICLLSFLFPLLKQKHYQRLIVFISCAAVILPAYFQNSAHYGNLFGGYVPAGDAYSIASTCGGLPILPQVDCYDGSRYNSYKIGYVRNASWLYGASGMDLYMNLYNGRIDMFHNSIALNTAPWCFGYHGLDRRSELLGLLGVNHFISPPAEPYLPVGFEIPESTVVYNSKSWRPAVSNSVFLRYSSAVSEEEYDRMSPYERQQLLLQACVLENPPEEMLLKEAVLDNSPVPFEVISCSDGLRFEDHCIHVEQAGSEALLSFPAQQDAELYLYFQQIHFEKDLQNGATVEAEAMLDGEPAKDMLNSFTVLNSIHHMYGGKHNWMMNLGLIPDRVNQIRLRFSAAGDYRFDEIALYSRSVPAIKENLQALNHDVSGIRYGRHDEDWVILYPNQIDVTVQNDRDEILFLSVPYSKGWKAFDNGVPVDIQVADLAFMALLLPPGEHAIHFSYRTPGLLVGLIISILSITAYCILEKKQSYFFSRLSPSNTIHDELSEDLET